MRLLLDTNALLWQIGSPDTSGLGPKARAQMGAADEVYVSAVSIIEMQIKRMLGKLEAPTQCMPAIVEAGDSLLAFSPEAADALATFPDLARHDPFDRMLLAQAQTERLTFVTADQLLLDLGFDFVIDARR